MVYEGLSAGALARNPGVEPVEYLWRPRRLLFLFGTRNRACGELAWNPKNIPPLFRFISSLSGPLLPLAPSGPFYSANRNVLSVARFRTILHAFSSRARKNGGAFLTGRRKIPFIFASRIRRGAFERRQRNMLMPVGTMKSWTAVESRISIKAIEAPMCGSLCDLFFCLPSKFTSGCKKYDL